MKLLQNFGQKIEQQKTIQKDKDMENAKNLNTEKIIKALQVHIGVVDMRCEKCPYNQDNGSEICIDLLMTDSLALIESYEKKIKELTEENERLRAENEALAISEVKECEISQMLVYRIRDKHPAVMAIRADTVKKMHSEIKKRCIKGGIYPAFVARTVENVVKEMLEGKR